MQYMWLGAFRAKVLIASPFLLYWMCVFLRRCIWPLPVSRSTIWHEILAVGVLGRDFAMAVPWALWYVQERWGQSPKAAVHVLELPIFHLNREITMEAVTAGRCLRNRDMKRGDFRLVWNGWPLLMSRKTQAMNTTS